MKLHPDALRVPTIHLNGTSRAALIGEYVAAREAVMGAIEAVKNITVHGRDYYPQARAGDPSPLTEAIEQHRDRLVMLETIKFEYEQILQRLNWEG